MLTEEFYKCLPYLVIAGKSVIIYLFIIVAIRIFGKKELSQLSVVDLVFILLISNSVQNAMVGDNNEVQGGIAAALGLFISNYIFKWLLRAFPQFSKIAQGDKIMLIHEGHLMKENLKRSMLSMEELEQVVREHGVKSITDVNLAVLEVDGNISVLSKDYSHKTIQRKKRPQTAHNP
ncbi:UPF0702 transmembrane protein YrbG [Filimonas sp.]|jgi:hypothetical protein|nr:UPF0702 transmembrane protein YrbG [Filimonas sp.]